MLQGCSCGWLTETRSPSYNAVGEMLKALDFEGNPLTVEYDWIGRRIAMESADMGRKEYRYDRNGNLERENDNVLRGRGEEITYRYNSMNRLVKTDYPQSEDITYEYGAPNAAEGRANRIARVSDETGTIEYKYGALGENIEETRRINRLDSNYVRDEAIFTRTTRYRSNYLGQTERIEYAADGERVTYTYNKGGQVNRVTGQKGSGSSGTFEYVKDIGYDEFGQRVYMEYGNDIKTSYEYDSERRWLDRIVTTSKNDVTTYQDIKYDINKAGNVMSYENDNHYFTTTQTYAYDDLYQLVQAKGASKGYTNRTKTTINYQTQYQQNFTFDKIGSMTEKKSESFGTIGANLSYSLAYTRAQGSPHRMGQIGDRYYRYDGNGNLLAERQGSPVPVTAQNATISEENGLYSTDYGFALADGTAKADTVYQRDYTWNERNLLTGSRDSTYNMTYSYGADGQRAIKYNIGTDEQSLYYNNTETLSYTRATANTREWVESKHIFVGGTRIVTKRRAVENATLGQEKEQQYFYHTDHLGSAQLITNSRGEVNEHIEYTPYGELWIEQRTAGTEKTPFRFTGKELDSETGLYYYGARYLNPQTSLWLSTDPAMGEYVPGAPINDDVRKQNQNLPGMGGVFNYVNMHLYHYAGNNPMVLVDPDGRADVDFDNKIIYADLTDIKDLDRANNYLDGFNRNIETAGFKVIARDGNGHSLVFSDTGSMTRFLNEVDPHTLVPDGKTLQIGLGVGVFLVLGVGVEVGISYSKAKGFDIYITGGIGYGVGVASDFTGNINVTDSNDLHLQTGMTATAGAGIIANFDLKENGRFTGIGVAGVGGGVLHTGTITMRGLWGNLKSAYSRAKEEISQSFGKR
jgi:RHS repeat-associated protein